MNGEPTQRELYGAILSLQDVTMRGFATLDGRLFGVERRLDGLGARIHELDEDVASFRIEVNRRLEAIEAAVT